MHKKAKQTYIGLAILIIIMAGIWLFKGKPTANDTKTNPSPAPQSQTPTPSTPTPSTSGNVWTGVLKTSDNSKKGNLMLATKERNIYIKTSRDFKALLDKNVRVSYTGSLDNFSLVDITAE